MKLITTNSWFLNAIKMQLKKNRKNSPQKIFHRKRNNFQFNSRFIQLFISRLVSLLAFCQRPFPSETGYATVYWLGHWIDSLKYSITILTLKNKLLLLLEIQKSIWVLLIRSFLYVIFNSLNHTVENENTSL